ncbi:hypothetical protein WKI13_11525 [Teredinibacter turnerae]|uniref:hypothetical protein n=1 Tax=Teredinibacter turnerae TaxID=2426 RepID=UPI00037590E5|nr:hypothetical protein [Teredinibacter turnerae]
MSIRAKISEFVGFVLSDKRSEDDLKNIIRKLYDLSLLVYAVEFEFDPEEYDDPPQKDYREIRKTVESKFPELGFYDNAEYTKERRVLARSM